MPGQHAVLSPSASHRWVNCPPSLRLEEKYPQSTSAAADEGTDAHTLCELLIRSQVMGEDIGTRIEDFQNSSDYYDAEMLEYCQGFCDYVAHLYEEAKKECPDPLIAVEQKTYLDEIVPGCFGTVDVRIVSDACLRIIDFKYGKGVKVEAENNTQLRIYAAGVLLETCLIYSPNRVETRIYQPRIKNITHEEMPTDGLTFWIASELVLKAKLALAGEGEFKAGHHCKFCKAAGECRAYSDMQLELAKMDFVDPATLQPDEIAQAIDKGEMLSDWLKAVKEYALKQAMQGVKYPGLKLVRGRSVRSYEKEEKVIARLREEGYSDDKILRPGNLRTITDISKMMGKAKFEEVIGPLLVKPPGAPTLVYESDKRAEMGSMQSLEDEFAEDIEV